MKILLWSCLVVLAACDEQAAPAWDKSEISATARAFSATVNGAMPGAGADYGERRGPRAIWSDSVAPLNAPAKSGAKRGTLAMTMLQGPEIVVGSLAVFVDATNGTIATDLETLAEKWRLTATSFEPGYLLTDGTALCGLAKQPPNNFNSATVQCVTLATGATLWSKAVPRWLTQAQGQGYGLAGQLVLHGTSLFLVGGGQVTAYALADGTELWSQAALAAHRGLNFVGNELVIENATANCTSGTNCLRALDPATGATVAEYAGAAAFLWTNQGTGYFLAGSGPSRMGVKYDSASHAFTEDPALAATFSGTPPLDLSGASVVLGGASELLPSNKVLLIAQNVQPGGGNPVLCRYAITTRKLDWCQQLPLSPLQLRAHPNVIFLAQNANTAQLPTEVGSNPGVTDFRFYFGHFAFSFGDVYAYR